MSALLALLHREKETSPKKAFFCYDVGILDCTISICNVLDRLNPKNNQKESSKTILKISSQVRSASFFIFCFSCYIVWFSLSMLCFNFVKSSLGFVVSSVCLS